LAVSFWVMVGAASSRQSSTGLRCKLTEKASVIGAHPLLDEPALIVKTEDIQ
jgi:hypothetical protein